MKIKWVNRYVIIKLQPPIFPLSNHVIRFHELSAEAMQSFLQ